MILEELQHSRPRRSLSMAARILRDLNLDGPLLIALLALGLMGMFALYSAGGRNDDLVMRQGLRLGLGLLTMLVAAQIPPRFYRMWAPWIFLGGMLLLALVLFSGDTGKGAQRWLDVKLFRFQPSEIMKLAVPLVAAWYLHDRPLPPTFGPVAVLTLVIIMPTLMIAVQPDLGTALLIASSGAFVILLAGLQLRVIAGLGLAGLALAWIFIKDYQLQRLRIFLNPESDPLGSGYHIIQSKIALGSGGLFGKGWLNGSQAQGKFLPEGSTDFIFAVTGEEFGLLGLLLILALYLFLVGRGLVIAVQAQGTFSRLLAGSISLTFFVYVFVNTGMVTGLLPVVGIPLPLMSYGGTSMVTLMAGFGILMAIQGHRKLLAH